MAKNDLTQSLERYLKTIFDIVEEHKAARIKDVSKRLNVGASSTSDAIKTLAERKYINYEPYGIITLTKKGEKKIQEKNKRHEIIKKWLKEILFINAPSIDEHVESIEYFIHEDVIDRFIEFLTFMQSCSCSYPGWLKNFHGYLDGSISESKCKKCRELHSVDGLKECCNGCATQQKN